MRGMKELLVQVLMCSSRAICSIALFFHSFLFSIFVCSKVRMGYTHYEMLSTHNFLTERSNDCSWSVLDLNKKCGLVFVKLVDRHQ